MAKKRKKPSHFYMKDEEGNLYSPLGKVIQIMNEGTMTKDWYNQHSNPLTLQIGADDNYSNRVVIDNAMARIVNHSTIRMDANALRFNDNTFSKVESFGSLECVSLLHIVKEVSRVLKVGGTWEFTLHRDTWWIRLYRQYLRPSNPKDRYFTTNIYKLAEVYIKLADAGLRLQKVRVVGYRAMYHCKVVKEGKDENIKTM